MEEYNRQTMIEIKELLKLAIEEEDINYVVDALDLLENPTIDSFKDYIDDDLPF